jgi:hypothetical protein
VVLSEEALQAPVKTRECCRHGDRDGQFRYINDLVEALLADGADEALGVRVRRDSERRAFLIRIRLGLAACVRRLSSPEADDWTCDGRRAVLIVSPKVHLSAHKSGLREPRGRSAAVAVRSGAISVSPALGA